MKQEEAELLRKYIKESLLVEEGDVAGVNFGGYPMAMVGQLGTGGGRDIANLFRKAAGDAIEAAKAVGEKAAAGVSAVGRTALAGLAELLSFGKIKANYDKIYQDFNSTIKSINQQHANAIKSSWEILGRNAPVMALVGLPAALPIKLALENPEKLGAVAALAGVGGIDVVTSKIMSMLGAPAVASQVATAVAGSEAGKKLSSESRNRKGSNRINLIIEASQQKQDLKQLYDEATTEQQAKVNAYIEGIKDKAEKEAKSIQQEVAQAADEMAEQSKDLTEKIASALKQAPDEKSREEAVNALQSVKDSLLKKKQEIFGDQAAPGSEKFDEIIAQIAAALKTSPTKQEPSKEQQPASSEESQKPEKKAR